MSGHTKGPWERLEGVVEAGHPIYKEGRVVVCIVQKRAPDQTDFVKVALVDTGSANARLIAAAPDLLEALERSAEGWANALELGIILPQHRQAATILRDEAQAAIARATEAQP